MKKMNVLILGLGGNVSQSILKALSMNDMPLNKIGACVNAEAAGLYLCDSSYISPYAVDPKFIPWVIDICNKERIHLILTGVEEIILSLQKNYDIIKAETNAVFIASSIEKLMIGQDKLLTCKWLEENGFNYPHFCASGDIFKAKELVRDCGYPLIGKPRKGKSSMGIILIENESDLKRVVQLDDYIIEEYIGTPGTEFTVGCYCSKDGSLIRTIIMHRKLKNGSTWEATVVDNESILTESIKICQAFKPKGPLNIQFRVSKDNRPICFEFNVRFSGTTSMRTHFGFQDVKALLNEYCLNDTIDDCFNIKKGRSFRFEEEVYIMDDSVEKLKMNSHLVINKEMITGGWLK